MEPLTIPPRTGHSTFLYAEPDFGVRLDRADIAFLGFPYCVGYSSGGPMPDQSRAPAALRAATDRISRGPDRYDFDLGGPLYDGRPVRAVDCGNVRADYYDPLAHDRRAEAAVRRILRAGALPVVLGGDHGIPIPVLRAYDAQDEITLVQIDQHMDWRDEDTGEPERIVSPIRRAAEMVHVGDIFQIGIRAGGASRPQEVDLARDYGARIVTAWDLHETGSEAVLARIPDGGRYYLTIDLGGLDPSVAPAVAEPSPGGVTFAEARALIRGLVRKGRVVGMDVLAIMPSLNVNGLTCTTAGRLIVNMLGAAARAGYFDRSATA